MQSSVIYYGHAVNRVEPCNKYKVYIREYIIVRVCVQKNQKNQINEKQVIKRSIFLILKMHGHVRQSKEMIV